MRALSSALAVTLLLASSAAVAQNAAPLRWTEGAPNATSEVKSDTKIEGLKTDDIHVYVNLADVKETEYNRVWVQVSNHSQTPIDFNPQSAVLVIDDKGKKVTPEVPEKAANSIQKYGEAKSQEMTSANCNMKGSSGHSVPGGGAVSASGAGCRPNDTQVQMAKQLSAFTAQQAQWVRDNGLKEKTLAPGEEVQGAIVFRKDKKPANYVLRVPVGSVVLEFPLSAQNKLPSYD
jgi:hypothetical protein